MLYNFIKHNNHIKFSVNLSTSVYIVLIGIIDDIQMTLQRDENNI